MKYFDKHLQRSDVLEVDVEGAGEGERCDTVTPTHRYQFPFSGLFAFGDLKWLGNGPVCAL